MGNTRRVCAMCGEPLPAGTAARRRYCSTACKSAWFRQYRRNGRGLELITAHTIGRGPQCPICGRRLAPGYFTRSDQVFCSGRCRTAAWRARALDVDHAPVL